MEFSLTTDRELVRSILTNPKLYRRMVNDHAPAIEDFAVRPASHITYVVAKDGIRALGLFLLVIDRIPGTAEVHFCMLPWAWGESEAIGKAFLEWVWRETSLTRLVGLVPSYNRLALKLARSVGFKDCEIHVGSVKKSGKEYDLILLEMERAKKAVAAEVG